MKELEYRAEIDGLRAIAVLAVVFYHAKFSLFSGGFVGVDIFFVISGYLIIKIIHTQLLNGSFSVLHFYERRARRILPALFVVSALCIIPALFLMIPFELSEFGDGLIAVCLFISNFFFWQKVSYLSTSADLNPLLHTWSLGVEEQFYLLTPLLLAFVVSFARKLLPALLLALIALSLGAALMTSGRPELHEAAFYLIYARAWELFAGGLVAVKSPQAIIGNKYAREILSILGLVGLTIPLVIFQDTTPYPGILTVIPVVGTMLFIAAASADTLAAKILAHRVFVAIGLISYSLYLIHQPVFAFARLYEGDEPSRLRMAILIVLAIALSFLSWRFVEQYFRNRRAVGTRTVLATVVVSGFCLIGVGTTIGAYQGFPSRFSELAQTMLETINREADLRGLGVRLGQCHYNSSFGDIETFLRNWNCVPTTAGPRLLTLGDSHSADKAWALRSAGLEIGNLGGAGCQIEPISADKTCRLILEKFVTLVKERKISGVIVDKRWTLADAAPQNIEAIGKFYQSIGIPVFVFTPMPSFKNFREKVGSINVASSLGEIQYDAALLSATTNSVSRLAAYGITVINTQRLFCGSLDGRCSAFYGQQPLLVEDDHLSSAGARFLGRRILESVEWRNWVASIASAAARSK